jgi:hypothetical protein
MKHEPEARFASTTSLTCRLCSAVPTSLLLPVVPMALLVNSSHRQLQDRGECMNVLPSTVPFWPAVHAYMRPAASIANGTRMHGTSWGVQLSRS